MADVDGRCQTRIRFQRLLVANRGEIARRILRSQPMSMGISDVSPSTLTAMPSAPFVAEADQAIALDGSTSTETYLDFDEGAGGLRSAPAPTPSIQATDFLAENAELSPRPSRRWSHLDSTPRQMRHRKDGRQAVGQECLCGRPTCRRLPRQGSRSRRRCCEGGGG